MDDPDVSTSTGLGSPTSVVFPKPPTPTGSPSRSESPLPLTDPPPPYPSRERRTRSGTTRSTRRTAILTNENNISAASQNMEPNTLLVLVNDANEATPLLSPRRRPRTVSHSTATSTRSMTHTVFSLFQNEDGSVEGLPPALDDSTRSTTTHTPASRRLKRYFRPLWKRAYYGPLFHLLVLNFPYALIAFLYLFVGTLTGTTLLIALPIGAVLCWLNLVGARAFSRGELKLQAYFHGPLRASPPYPPNPIFTRPRIIDESVRSTEVEAGRPAPATEPSFLKNTYSMFTDPTSYQALFYFLVIKPSITLFLTITLIVVIPVSFVLIVPAPAILRAVKRIGIWQANIAVEGLSRPRL